MKRLLAAFSITILVATLAVVMPAAPASADVDVCAGIGSVALPPPGLVYPVFDPVPRKLDFSFALGTGACVVKPSGVNAVGTVTGWCGLSSGWGATDNSHNLHFVGVGGLLLVTGQVNGAVVAVPDPLAGSSCTMGAERFVITGGAVKTHCGVGVSFDLTMTPPAFTSAVYAASCVS